MPFRWTVNPTRGCLHACTYCFARPTHEYLDLDAGRDFETQIVVKTNVVEVLRAELARPSWARRARRARHQHRPVPTGRGPVPVHAGDHRGARRQRHAAVHPDQGHAAAPRPAAPRRGVRARSRSASASRWRSGTRRCSRPSNPGRRRPRARLDLIRAVREAGLPCGVMVAPVLPWLTDDRAQLDDLLGVARRRRGDRASRCSRCTCADRSSRCSSPGCAEHAPGLVHRYEALYGRGAYVPREYARWLDDARPAAARPARLRERGGSPRGPQQCRARGCVPDRQHRRRCDARPGTRGRVRPARPVLNALVRLAQSAEPASDRLGGRWGADRPHG